MDSQKRLASVRLEDTAAQFLARRDSGHWSAQDQAALEAWLAASTVHRVTYLRLEAAWEEALRLRALGAGRSPGSVPAPGEWRDSPFFERTARTGSAANPGVVLVEPCETEETASHLARPATRDNRSNRQWWIALAASVLLTLSVGGWYALRSEGNRYTAALGQVVSVPLKDGSEVTLNTSSEVHVDLTPTERRVNLDRGEAFFSVAKDPGRPFVVRAGKRRITAVGTQFSVRLEGNDVRVAVAEGTVRIDSADAAPPRRLLQSTPEGQIDHANELGETLLSAGGVASATDAGTVVRDESLPAVNDELSWRQGYLTFHDTALADVVMEFNRYNANQIVIEDPEIAAIHISGTFRASNADAFIRVLDEGFAIHARTYADRTTLTRR